MSSAESLSYARGMSSKPPEEADTVAAHLVATVDARYLSFLSYHDLVEHPTQFVGALWRLLGPLALADEAVAKVVDLGKSRLTA